MFLFFAILGGLLNRIRGGAGTDYIRAHPKLKEPFTKIGLWQNNSLRFVKDINAIVFGIAFGFATNIYFMPLYYGAMRAGLSLGWGGYISAMIDKKIDHNRDDVTLLDKWFRSNSYPVLSGWAALSLRGLMATIILALPFYQYTQHLPIMMLLGISMGSVYLAACEVCQHITTRGNGWQWGEVVFGALLWGSYYALLS